MFAAIRSDGYHADDMTLHDDSVWVTKSSRIGRYNTDLQLVDTQSPSFASGIAELQQVDANVLVTTDDRQMYSIDVALAGSRAETPLPATAIVSIGGKNGALLDPETTRLWFTDGSSIGSIQAAPPPGEALTEGYVELPGATDVVVGTDGSAHVLARASGQLWTFTTPFDLQTSTASTTTRPVPGTGPTGTLGSESPVQIPKPVELGVGLGDVEITTAGPRAVVLDQEGHRLLLDDGSVIDLPASVGQHAKLQLTSADGTGVLVASDTSLVFVPLDESTAPSTLDSKGGEGALRPLRLNGCSFGAWLGSSLRRCDSDQAAPTSNPTPTGWDKPLTFRTNRGQVILNFADGNLLAFTPNGVVQISSWNQALDPDSQEQNDNEEDEQQQTEEENPCDYQQGQNSAPVGVPDSFHVRAGQTTVLEVLSGVGSDGQPDNDPDCDVLTVSVDDGALDGAGGTIDVIREGRALQYTAPSTSGSSSISFSYALSDGVNPPQPIGVTVDIVGDENSPPIARNDQTTIEAGGTVVIDVLSNDSDPESDPIVVAGATLESPAGDVLVWQPNGRISYTPPGGVSGQRIVTYEISDSSGATATAELAVAVLPTEGNQKPNTVDDSVVGLVGNPLTVDLLANDSDPNNDPISLANVVAYDPSLANPTATNQDAGGQLTFTAQAVGSFNFVYTITDSGGAEATGRLRVEVLPEGEHAPIAVRDSAVLTAQKPTIVDVLANDIDLDGDVLMVTDVDLVGDAARDLSASIIDNRMIRLSATTATPSGTGSYVVHYTETDGLTARTGSIEVRFSTQAGGNSPIALDDRASVHLGGVLSLPVVANDFDPDGDSVVLVDAEIDQEEYNDGDPGQVFVQGDRLRYLPPRAAVRPVAFTVTGLYTISDAPFGFEGRTDKGRFTIEVTPSDQNHAPRPTVLELRTFAGETREVVLPAFGLDPDGDVVTIDGVEQLPTHGSLSAPLGTKVEYTPTNGYTGRDEFVLRVLDAARLR